jgi:hypothetical protein
MENITKKRKGGEEQLLQANVCSSWFFHLPDSDSY